jgi:predicted DNA-binding WGR domain protein
MRRFTQNNGSDERFVEIDVRGRRMTVVSGKANGSPKRQEKDFADDGEAKAAGERLAQEMLARGYVQQAKGSKSATVSTATQPVRKPPKSVLEDVLEEPADPAMPVLSRMSRPAQPGAGDNGAEKTPKAKKKKRKKKKTGDQTDWIFVGGTSVAGTALIGLLSWFIWSSFLKPATIIGTWQGSKTEYEPSKPIIYTHYRLALNEQGRARMVRQKDYESVGTYRVVGNRLKLSFANEDGEGEGQDLEYKFTLSSVTLALFDPSTGKPIVELTRMSEMDKVPGPTPKKGQEPDGDAAVAAGGTEPALNPNLATQDHVAKDLSFACKYPKGWEPNGGSRPDNTFAWAEFTNDSAKARIDADVTGSLMADIQKGPNGDEDATVAAIASAHAKGKRKMAENFSKYEERAERPFKNPSLGDGRISEFTADGSGLFGAKQHGYRATLLTNDRRVTIVCTCPETQWEKLKPTFYAVIQSIKR